MGLDEIEAVSDMGRRERYGARLRREREALGLSQGDLADRLVAEHGFGSAASAQKAVSRAERGVESSEDLLRGVEAVLGLRESYPSAPKDPVRRRAWFDQRNRQMRPSPPPSGIFGGGKVA